MVQIKLSLLFILVTAAIAPILALPLPTDNEDLERHPKRQIGRVLRFVRL